MTKKRRSDPHLKHDGGDFYTCMLYETGSMHRKCVNSHLSGYLHKQKLIDRESQERMKRLKSDGLFWFRVVDLGLSGWKWHIKGMILDHIFQAKYMESEIERQLTKYEKMERTSLLELALWRASCLHFDGSKNFQTMQDILDQWTLDENFDPAAYKAERRFTSNVAVVTRQVVKFL